MAISRCPTSFAPPRSTTPTGTRSTPTSRSTRGIARGPNIAAATWSNSPTSTPSPGTYLVQGPVWYGLEPIHGKLENGQWIPDALFLSALFLHKKVAKSWTWLMENSTTVKGANLREITLDQLEQLTGLYCWGNVRSNKFKERRNKRNSGTRWWMAGQPSS